MKNIDVTRRGTPGGKREADDVPLEDCDEVAHERIVQAVQWLLTNTEVTQRELADLLEIPESSMSRALVTHASPRARRRNWRANEVFRLAVFFNLPVEVFYGTNVERVWEERMADARRDHAVLLKALDESSE